MMRRVSYLTVLLLTLGNAWAADLAPLQEPPKQLAKTAPGYLFAKPVVLRGMLGEQKIQANLRPKEDITDGIEGDYFVFGGSVKILLAGDLNRGIFIMEESQDGKDISGRWEGTQEGDSLRGTWQSADGSITKPFVLAVVKEKPVLQKASATRAKPALPAATAPPQ
jgi:hypothetical protein